MPGYRQMPKLKGFTNHWALETVHLNVRDLERLALDEVTLDLLKEMNKVSPKVKVLRILGNGEITKAVTVKAGYFSPSAKEKIEKAGGKTELV